MSRTSWNMFSGWRRGWNAPNVIRFQARMEQRYLSLSQLR